MSTNLILLEKCSLSLLFSLKKTKNIFIEHKDYQINDIYIGKISSLIPSLNAAFITLEPNKKNGFISFSKLKKQSLKKGKKSYKNEKFVLVQIIREPSGNKGPNLTGNLHLKGKYVYLYPLLTSLRLIKSVKPTYKKNYFQTLGHLLTQKTFGSICVKLEAIISSPNFLTKEIQILQIQWIKILNRFRKINQFNRIGRQETFLNKVLFLYSKFLPDLICIDSKSQISQIKNSLCKIYKKKKIVIKFYPTGYELIKRYSVDLVINKFLKPTVFLGKGSYLIIEKTEALTVIDINSGSFTSLTTLQNTSTWVNSAALYQVMHQIQLRNLGGVIILDLIDSYTQRDQIFNLQYFNALMRKNKLLSTIIQMSELGLLEIIRNRQGQNIYDAFTYECNLCRGLGYRNSISINSLQKDYLLLLDIQNTYQFI
uniref:ribonuclease E n=1 Tax=Cryptomonas gyropyrenoidosa TaxID=233257 RepID=UPI0027AB7172|nr:ribonuclease E [Cryptomonas gyropyrenoidosa]WFQ82941.1 ribonuclease E [Cryptomonas gyropyrenoidosa]